jgi:hypothetical protein
MDVIQCPECPLRFLNASELEQHLALEHPEFHAEAQKAEDGIVAAVHRAHRRRQHHDPKS